MAFIKRSWSHLPSRIAMLLGLSAVSAIGAEAAPVSLMPGGEPVRVPQQSAKALDDLLIWQESGHIFVSEGGKPAEELRLSHSAQANALRQLLAQQHASAATPHVMRDRIILVGAGGDGFHMQAARSSDTATKTRGPAKKDSDNPEAVNQANASNPAGSGEPKTEANAAK